MGLSHSASRGRRGCTGATSRSGSVASLLFSETPQCVRGILQVILVSDELGYSRFTHYYTPGRVVDHCPSHWSNLQDRISLQFRFSSFVRETNDKVRDTELSSLHKTEYSRGTMANLLAAEVEDLD